MLNRNGKKSVLSASEDVRKRYSNNEKYRDDYYTHALKDSLLFTNNMKRHQIFNTLKNKLVMFHWKLFLYSSLFWVIMKHPTLKVL